MTWGFDYNKKLPGFSIFTVVFILCILVFTLEGSTIPEEKVEYVEEYEAPYIPLEFQVMSNKRARDFEILVNSKQVSIDILKLYKNPSSKQSVIDFFEELTGNITIATSILEESERRNVSPSLSFALAYRESRFKPLACHQNAKSVDRGLFQLNSLSFPNLSVDQFYDVGINARYGVKYLKQCLDLGGNEITALAAYNAGMGRVSSNATPQKTLNYIDSVLRYRDCIESLFEVQVVAKSTETGAVAYINSLVSYVSD